MKNTNSKGSQKQSLQSQVPVILYEEPTGKNDGGIPFPYIEIPKEGAMPPVLFIFEYKHTGEFEPDEKGNPAAIVDQYLHKYVDLEHLKDKLSPATYDMVRVALGMKPLKEAQVAGQKILDKVKSNVANFDTNAERKRIEEERNIAEASKKLEDMRNRLANMEITLGLATDEEDNKQ